MYEIFKIFEEKDKIIQNQSSYSLFTISPIVKSSNVWAEVGGGWWVKEGSYGDSKLCGRCGK